MQVIAVNDEVAVKGYGADPLALVRNKRAKRNGQMVIVDEFFALEVLARSLALFSLLRGPNRYRLADCAFVHICPHKLP